MKKSHTKKTEVDLLVPIVPESVTPVETTDCFGIEFESRSSECVQCADNELCMIVWAEKVKDKEKIIEKDHGPFLNKCDFPAVDMTKIERLAKRYQDEGSPMTLQELQDVIAQQANTKDTEAVIQFIKRELPLSLMYLKEGVVYVR
jgi:hypothetical protein